MGKRVIIVEDEQYIRELYEMILKQEGYEVMSAEEGDQGLAMVIEQKPDLILLDIMLPKKNGVDILKEIMENPTVQNIPVVMLTNLGQESVMAECLRIGAKEYIIKLQIDPYSLVNVVKKYTDTPAAASTPTI